MRNIVDTANTIPEIIFQFDDNFFTDERLEERIKQLQQKRKLLIL